MKNIFVASAVCILSGISCVEAVASTAVDLTQIDTRCTEPPPARCSVEGPSLTNGNIVYISYSYDGGVDPGGPEFHGVKFNLETHKAVWVSDVFDQYAWDSGNTLKIENVALASGKLMLDVKFYRDAKQIIPSTVILDEATGAVLQKPQHYR